MSNNKGSIAPSTILVSCLAITLLLLGFYFMASTSLDYYGVDVNDSFEQSVDQSDALKELVQETSGKLDNSTGTYSESGGILFDGLNSIVLGFRAMREVVTNFTAAIAMEFGIPDIIVDILVAILVLVLVAAIVSVLWSREV